MQHRKEKTGNKAILAKPFILAILLAFFSLKAYPQHSISGTIEGYASKPISLLMLRGELRLPIDSTYTDTKGFFRFEVKNWVQPGMFELKTQDGSRLTLLYNHETIHLESGRMAGEDKLHFTQSLENQLWYDYWLAKTHTKELQDLLKPLLAQYPPNEIFYRQTIDEYNRLQLSLKKKADSIFNCCSQTLAARYVHADAPAIVQLGLDFEQQKNDLLLHFFDQLDFADTSLIFSDILTRKMIDFLALHQSSQMNIAEIQSAFINGLDVILEKASVENATYLFVLEYFIEGFARMGLTVITDYLSTLPHFKSDCVDLYTLTELERIAGPHRKIISGSPAPDLLHTTLSGESFSLDQTLGKLKILIFWSVSCPHCIESLPKLKQLSAEFPQISVLSFVVSNDRQKLDEIIRNEQIGNWVHMADGLEWASPVVQSYMVYGTPTFYLLDEENHILAKPISITEMREILLNYYLSKE